MSLDDFTERFNRFLYQRAVRKLAPEDLEAARAWCLDFIRREHPRLSEPEVIAFYDNLLKIRISAVDEWTRRNE
jgi:hypothetical protein